MRAPRPRVGRRTAVAVAALASAAAADHEWLRPLFDEIDANSDGRIDEREYFAYAEQQVREDGRMEQSGENFFFGLSGRAILEADVDGDGALSIGELGFSEYLKQLASRATAGPDGTVEDEFGKEVMTEQIRMYDEDRDGFISESEFTQAMRSTLVNHGLRGYLDDPDVVEWLAWAFRDADSDGSGRLVPKQVHSTAYLAHRALLRGPLLSRVLSNDITNDLDANGNEVIDAAEVVGPVTPGTVGDDVRKAFDEIDANGDKILDRADVAKFTTALLS